MILPIISTLIHRISHPLSYPFRKITSHRQNSQRPPILINYHHLPHQHRSLRSTTRPPNLRLKKYLIPVLVFLLLSTIIFIVYQVFINLPTGSISCSSQYGTCIHSIQDTLDTFQNQSLIDSLSIVPKRIEQQYPGVKFIKWHYDFPNQLQIILTMPKAQYALSSTNPNFPELILVDYQGSIVGVTHQSPLPHISIDQLSWANSHLPTTIIQAIQILSLLDQQKYSYHSPTINQNQLTFILNQHIQAILPLDHFSPQHLLTALQLVLNRSTIDTSQISLIDLRFSKPVVK